MKMYSLSDNLYLNNQELIIYIDLQIVFSCKNLLEHLRCISNKTISLN